jgi:hypothetical protein
MTGRLSREKTEENRQIREWAAGRRLPCPDRGPIPPLVREAWIKDGEAARWVMPNSGPPYRVPEPEPGIMRHRNSGPPDIA